MATYKKALKNEICEKIQNGASIDTLSNEYNIKKTNIKGWYKKYETDPTVFDEVPKTYDSVKDELQGNGIIKQVRSLYLGSTDEMALLARQKYEEKTASIITKEAVLANTDEILKGLISAETEIFNEKANTLAENVIPIFYQNIYNETSEYTHMNKLIQALLTLYNNVRNNQVEFDYFITDLNHHMIPVSQHIAVSNSQSAKIRAGASLEHHLATLLTICEFPYDTQKQVESGETIADFFLPNEDSVFANPSVVMNVECQTTLKDRHRLTSGKFTDYPLMRFLATGTGCGLFNKKDVADFTFDKLKELILSNNLKLIVFQDVKETLINKINNELDRCISDSEYRSRLSRSDLETLKARSTQQILSFTEFFNNQVAPFISVWQANNLY